MFSAISPYFGSQPTPTSRAVVNRNPQETFWLVRKGPGPDGTDLAEFTVRDIHVEVTIADKNGTTYTMDQEHPDISLRSYGVQGKEGKTPYLCLERVNVGQGEPQARFFLRAKEDVYLDAPSH